MVWLPKLAAVLFIIILFFVLAKFSKRIIIKVSKKLNLETEIIQKNVFNEKKLDSGTIMARAFKPLPIILDLINKNFNTYKNLILFMGKNGKKTLKETLIEWNFEYTEKKSLTSNESFLLNIKNIKKKTLN